MRKKKERAVLAQYHLALFRPQGTGSVNRPKFKLLQSHDSYFQANAKCLSPKTWICCHTPPAHPITQALTATEGTWERGAVVKTLRF